MGGKYRGSEFIGKKKVALWDEIMKSNNRRGGER